MKVLLVDDHGIFREGTALLLRSLDPAIEITHARSSRECVEQAALAAFDLVFLDLGLPDRPGLDALIELKAVQPDLPVIVLSGQEDRETVLESIKRGAMGFIPKSSDDPKLLWHALKLAVSGAITVPESVTAGAPRTVPHSSAHLSSSHELGLSPRQTQVLQLLVQGLPNKSIARRLDIAEATARGYVSDLLAAFRVTNRTQLVLEVARRGISVGKPAGGAQAAATH